MHHRYRWLIGIGVIALIVGAKAYQDSAKQKEEARLLEVQQQQVAPIKNPPEFKEKIWFNTEGNKPLRLKDLKGKKVVLIQFWRFKCPHCAQVTPNISALHKAFKQSGLVVIGIHTPVPEDPEENDVKKVEQKIREWRIDYPVVLDNDQRLWKAYKATRYPTFFLIDKDGKIERRVESDLPQAMAALGDGVKKLCSDLNNSPGSEE
ncbi:MAG: redoxin domain-containing protein [Abditibacteriales bacterium]|nr:redoxin domain-containing protein [Abditibacteriales bacterium]MDW8364461.1 redoxin domain-containing protein [Abditibacteriales bacterium]